MSNSINTNIAAFYAQQNITTASNASTENVARLSSGNAIVEASDNVSALAIGTSIGTQVSVLQTAQTNAAQGSSLLQVADGALAQIQSILQQQQSIANQAQSGTLTDTDRGFLNQEFQQLTNEINNLASGTTFNGVALINGAISGGNAINTNVTNGSASLPVTAQLATIGNNVANGDTFSITVAGQPVQTLTFGTATGDVAVGNTADDSLANLSSALNNSGLSQLSDFRFEVNGSTLSAYYTGNTTGITNIPALTVANTGTALTSTAAPAFSAATAIGNFTSSSVIAAGDTFTIGSHTITFAAEGSTYTGTSNPYAVTTLGNGDVNIGLPTGVNGVTGTALTNLAAFLTSVAGTAGWSDLAGINFTTNGTVTSAATQLYAAYTGGGSTQPTLSTTYTSNSSNNFSGGNDVSVNGSQAILSSTANFTAGSQLQLGNGTAITFVSNGTTPGAGQVQLGTGGSAQATTLANLVTFLNTAGNSAYVGSAFTVGGATATFSTDGANLYANNTNNTGTPYTVTTSYSNQILSSSAAATAVGGTDYVTAGDANSGSYATGSGVALLTHATSLAATDTVSIGSATFTLGSGGTTAGLYINATTANTDDLVFAAIANYLNTAAGQAAAGSSINGLTFTDNSTNHTLVAFNATDTNITTGPTVAATAGTVTVDTGAAITAQKGAVLTVASASGHALQDGTSITVGTSLAGGNVIRFGTSAEVTAGTAQVVVGANDGATLANLRDYLNSTAGQLALGGTINGLDFTTNGTTGTGLFIGNSTVSQLAGATAPAVGLNISNSGPATATVLNAGTTGDINGSNAYKSNAIAQALTGGTAAVSGDNLVIGSATITFGTSQATGGGYVNTSTDGTLTEELTAIAKYLNTTAGQTAVGASGAGLVYENVGGTALTAYNATDAAISTGPTVSTSSGSLTVSNSAAAFSAQNGAVLTVASSTGHAIQNGTSLTVGTSLAGGTLITFGTSAEVTAGTAQVVTGATDAGSLNNLRDFLNSTAGQAYLGGTLNTNAAQFTTNGTGLFIANSTASALTGATAPLVVVNSTQLTAATTAGSFSGTSAISAGSVLKVGSNANVNSDINSSTVYSIGGKSITFGNQSAVAGGTADVLIGTSNVDTLANLATYLNTAAVNANLGTYSGLTFSSNATSLIATNNTALGITTTTATSFTGTAPVGAAGAATTTIAAAANYTVLTAEAGTELSNYTTVDIGGITGGVTFGTQAQVTAGTADVAIGANNQVTLTNLANYLNTTSVNENLTGNYSNFTFTSDGTHLIATNNAATAKTAGTVTFGAGTPTGATGYSAASVASGASADVLTLGVNTLVFGSGSQVTSGAANVNAGTTLAQSLDNAVTYLNGLGGAQSLYNTSFSTNGQLLLAQSGTGSPVSVTSSFTSTDPLFTGVTGQIITASGVVGLGAGVTSALGTPTGSSLFVSSTGTSATNYGDPVDLSNIANNADFLGAFGGSGSIGAITASYVNTGVTATSGVQFSVVVGNDTYTTSTIENSVLDGTAPVALTFTGSNTTTSAAEGGSFTLNLQPQAEVTSQNAAGQLATGINAALANVSAYQNRNVLSYNNNYSAEVSGVQTATLEGSSLAFNSNDFTDPSVSSVTVSAPSTGSTDAKITAVVNGDTYTTGTGIGDTFGANDEIVLQNESNPNQTLTLTLGSTGSADLSNASSASAFQTALSNALGLSTVSGGLVFQLGASAAANVNVTIGSATSSALFGGASLDVSTANDAATASTAVGNALNTITASRATVGAFETQFNFASAALQSSVQNETAAESSLLDTNVATESTAYATNQVKLQAGISVLAQANQQAQALLKLLG